MRDKFKEVGPLPVAGLMLDQCNFRLGELASQKECIEAMFLAYPTHMLALAEHIARHGLSPEPIAVIPDEEGKWLVLDGNRRVAALKLLNNPAEAPDAFKAKVQSLKDNATATIPHEIKCLTAEREVVFEFMELRHLGLQNGAGQMGWESREQDNLRIARGQAPRNAADRAIIDYLTGKGVADAREAPPTNLQRLFNDPDVQQRVGIAIKNGVLTVLADEADVFNVIRHIVLDFAGGGYKVGDIFYKEDRVAYLDNFFGVRGFSPPKVKSVSVAGQQTGPAGGVKPGGQGGASTTPPRTPVRSSPRRRHKLIRAGMGLPFPKAETKMLSIQDELANHISVSKAPIAASVLIRLIVERSVDFYIRNNGIKVDRSQHLHKKIVAVAIDMESRGRLSREDAVVFRKIGNSEELISADTMHKWIHSATYIPCQDNVCTLWDNLYSFLDKCWR